METAYGEFPNEKKYTARILNIYIFFASFCLCDSVIRTISTYVGNIRQADI